MKRLMILLGLHGARHRARERAMLLTVSLIGD